MVSWYNTAMNYEELKIVPQVDSAVVCCFTGNRPHKLPWREFESDERCKKIKSKLKKAVLELAQNGTGLFICGMAQGADTFFAEIVLEIRKTYPQIKLECALPFLSQAKSWGEKEQARYKKILEQADYITVVSEYPSRYAPLKRNRYMVEKSSVLLSVNYDETGGSAYTERIAHEKGLKIIKIIE